MLRCWANIQPVAIASSIQGETSINKIGIDFILCYIVAENLKKNDDDVLEVAAEDLLHPMERPTKEKTQVNTTALVKSVKRNKHTLYGMMETITNAVNTREERRERRHEEALSARNRAIDVFSEKMDALLATLRKNKVKTICCNVCN
ncbi:hypothetical protein QE152_g38573 [Popillia japonica]|uniref:Uncharacterized protein n=1 Tax=Popillia japonica TaxID=7064 RepID=A0AAW1HXL6_POPJA